MPHLLFGFKPTARGSSKLSIQLDGVDYEPVEPSRFKVFVSSISSPLWSIAASCMGLVVAILSYPFNSYIQTSSTGITFNPAKTYIPFLYPGLAVVLRKGTHLLDTDVDILTSREFTSINFSGRIVWITPTGSREDLLAVDKMIGVDPIGPAPNRYLNTHSFRAFLTLLSLTTRICEVFHYLSTFDGEYPASTQSQNSILKDMKHADTVTAEENEDDDAVVTPVFTKESGGSQSAADKGIAKFFKIHLGATGQLHASGSSALVNSIEKRMPGFIGLADDLKTRGIVAKFHPRLSLPDPNLIGDIIGRYFLKSLGSSATEILENFNLLKTGLPALRLTRVGEELTHLYKCIEIAIQCHSGCVPIISSGAYEGCAIAGGHGATLLINGELIPFGSAAQLKYDIATVSEHMSTLEFIAKCASSTQPLNEDGSLGDSDADKIRSCSNMWDLRLLCVDLVITQDKRDEIIRRAAYLRFRIQPWVLSPSNLSLCFRGIADLGDLKPYVDYPISRLTLFSKDKTFLMLSCFGEKSAPSWDIPNGVKCSLKRNDPPTVPEASLRKGAGGKVNDAAWVMVVRTTDVMSAVEDFRRMSGDLSYRSTSSELAKRVGHRVFGRDRMVEFWGDMREACRAVNPNVVFEEGSGSLKRGATDSSALETGGTRVPAGKRRMKF